MHIRVLTYNIHKCIGGVDRRYQPERIAETIAHHDADVVLLQEVDDGAGRSLHHRQVDLLGDLLGYRSRTYFPNVRVRGGGVYGNAILSRFPIVQTQNIPLSVPLTKPRSALHARLRVRRPGGRPARTLHVYNLHLGLSQVLRRLQLERFLGSTPFVHLDARTPILLAGDFNDVWGTLGRRFLEPVGFRGAGKPLRTFPAWAPLRALDCIYVRGDLRATGLERSSALVARRASDHLPLIADLRMVPRAS